MEAEAEGVLSTYVHFSRLLSEARDPDAILSLLAEVALEHLKADASLVLRVTEGGGMRVSASRTVPQGACESQLVAETIGQELEEQLLVSSRNLYGALMLLFQQRNGLRSYQQRLARGALSWRPRLSDAAGGPPGPSRRGAAR